VRLHRALGDAEVAGDLFVQLSRDDEGEHLALARRERLVARPQRTHVFAFGAARGFACERVRDGCQQLTYLSDLSMSAMLDRLKQLGPHTLVLVTLIFLYGATQRYFLPDLGPLGAAAGQMGLRILDGQSRASVRVEQYRLYIVGTVGIITFQAGVNGLLICQLRQPPSGPG
jgi:hypothetical protein